MKSSGARKGARLFPPALALLLALLPAVAPAAPGDLDFQALPLQRSRQNHLLVRAEINGKPALLAVDSGALVSAVALKRRKHFGLSPIPDSSELPTHVPINGGFNRVAIAHHLRIGNLILVDEPMVVIDLSGPTRVDREFDEQEVDGILGTDILFPTQAVLDCGEQVLIMKVDPDARGATPGADHRGARAVPIHVTEGWNLYVDSKINGRPGQLMIDTGAFMTLLDGTFLAGMGVKLRDTPYTSGAINLEESDLQLTTIADFAVGRLKFGKYLLDAFALKNKEIGVTDLRGLFNGTPLVGTAPVAGLLGSEFLRRHHGIIDFGTRTLYLKP